MPTRTDGSGGELPRGGGDADVARVERGTTGSTCLVKIGVVMPLVVPVGRGKECPPTARSMEPPRLLFGCSSETAGTRCVAEVDAGPPREGESDEVFTDTLGTTTGPLVNAHCG